MSVEQCGGGSGVHEYSTLLYTQGGHHCNRGSDLAYRGGQRGIAHIMLGLTVCEGLLMVGDLGQKQRVELQHARGKAAAQCDALCVRGVVARALCVAQQ